MKKSFAWFIMLLVVVLCMGAYLQTHRQRVVSYRIGVVGATDVTLGTERKWSSRTRAKLYKLPSKWNEVIFYLRGSAEGITCVDMEIWGYPEKSAAVHIWTGSITAGAIVADDGTYYADTIVTQKDNSPGGISLVDAGADNGVSNISFDARQVEHILVLFPTISSGSWSCYIHGD